MWQCITRLTTIIGTWSLLAIWSFIFDDLLYPLAIYKYGTVVGGCSMALIASVLCLFQLCWYERTGVDWLGINVVENIKTKGESWVNKLDRRARGNFFWFLIGIVLYLPSRFFLIVLWAVKKNDVSAFVALSIAQDPFVTTVFLRHGRFNGLKARDWCIFAGSLILCNGYWIARSSIVVDIIKFFWNRTVQN